MILDTLERSARYVHLHAEFARAFSFLSTTDLRALPLGKHAIDGDRLFVLLDRQQGRGHDGAKLEAHRRYIDIQLTLDGIEQIGWRALSTCTGATDLYDEAKDIVFFNDVPTSWIGVPPSHFAIFFPDDTHAPLAGREPVWKAVVKVAVG